MSRVPLLSSWYIAGFEGSTHRRSDGRRLDLVAATQHDQHAQLDYRRMRRAGITSARETLRWHLVERSPGMFDFERELARLDAVADQGITVAWDLCHFGWPDHVDPRAPDFAGRYAAWAQAVGRVLAERTPPPYWIAPQNEISFAAWALDAGAMNPMLRGHGRDAKRAFVRGTVAAMDALRGELPGVRFIHPEPLINVAADPSRPHERQLADDANEAQFEAWDLLVGRLEPELGGGNRYLDVVGVNFYPHNQWSPDGTVIEPGDPRHMPLAHMLRRLHDRYGRDILISETGAEDDHRAPWVRFVADEVERARRAGVPVGGICLYPILNHPGWEDDRHCRNGIWDYPDRRGRRRAHRDLLATVATRTTRRLSPGGQGHPVAPSRAIRPSIRTKAPSRTPNR